MKLLFILFQYCVPQHALSRLTGKLAASENTKLKCFLIDKFIKKFGVSLNEAKAESAEEYVSFNDFFCRELKEGARPIDENAKITSPADGAFSQLGKIQGGRIFQAKNHSFTTEELLANEGMAAHFSDGDFATIYLSPKDYHRVHMPVSGKLVSMSYIPGDLFSVNEATAESVPRLFARNERAVCIFETELGYVAAVLVGAMIVASIETVWAGQIAPAATRHIEHWDYRDQNIVLNKGDEFGRFKLGSTVVLLFSKDAITWSNSAKAGASVQMGERIAD